VKRHRERNSPEGQERWGQSLAASVLVEDCGAVVVTGDGRTISKGDDVVVKGLVVADIGHVRISEGGKKKRTLFSSCINLT